MRGQGERPSRGTRTLHAVLVLLGVAVVAGLAESAAQWAAGGAALAGLVLGLVAQHVLAPRARGRGRLRAAVLAAALGQWIFYAALCVGVPYATTAGPDPAAPWFYGAVLAALLALYLPLLGKVRRLELR